MGDKRNFAALEWVVGEISETLREARHSLEAYVEDPKDTTRIRFCLTHIHQVQGSLQMVEFHGAALLAEELEHTAQAIMNNNVSNIPEAQEVLMRGLLQLPTFLDHIKSNRDDNPAVVLPLLNDMRAVRKESYLSETNLFSPDLSSIKNISGSKHPLTGDKTKLTQFLKKLREMYQFAAASVLRGIKVEENFDYIEKVFTRLETMTRGTACHPTWEISSALIEGLKEDSIELTVAVRGLLRYIARELRILGDKAPGALDITPKESLLKNLLYYVARAEDGGKRITEVKQKYALDRALIGNNASLTGKGDVLQTQDNEAIKSVVIALQEELSNVKHILDLSLTGQGSVEDLKDILPTVKRVADTMAILGIGDLRKQMISQNEALEELSNANSINEDQLMNVAHKIIEIEQRLNAIGKSVGKHSDLSSVNEREVEIDAAKATVISECCAGLEKVKDAISEYMSSSWDSSHLNDVGSMMTHIRGGLNMIPLRRSAEVVRSCGQFIEEKLVQEQIKPDSNILFNLSDAIVSIEYYLERLTQNIDDDADSFLDMAEESVKSLGYAVSAVESDKASAAAEAEKETVATEQMPDLPAVEEAEIPAAEVETATAETEVGELAQDEAPSEKHDDASEEAALEPQEMSEADSDTHQESSVEASEVAAEAAPAAPATPEELIAAAEDLDENEDSEIDEEIVEIFIEEAGEVLETLNEFFPQWRANEADNDALVVVRRAFHTLKGSGRMVEAYDIGELAWAIENMLNRVIDKTITLQPHVFNLIQAVMDVVPLLVTAFEKRKKNPIRAKTDQYAEWAHAVSEGNFPPEIEHGIPEIGGTAAPAPAAKEAALEETVEALEEVAEHTSDEGSDESVEEDLIEVATADDDEVEELNLSSLTDDDEPDEEEDAVLREIFSSESLVHLHTIQLYINAMEEEAPIYAVPSDNFQRALHTLKGSAKMAQVWPIAEITEPLEAFAKELISYQVNVNEDILQLIRDAVTYTREGLKQIRSKQPVVIEKVPQFVARCAELRELAVGHLIHLKERPSAASTNKADPRMLSLVMAEEMALLLRVESLLNQWQESNSVPADITKVISELRTLEEGASLANLPDMASLSSQLMQMHQKALASELPTGEEFFSLLGAGHDALLDMVDAVAASQNVVPAPETLTDALANYLAQPAANEEVDTQALEEAAETVDETPAEADQGEALSDEFAALMGGETEEVDADEVLPEITLDEASGDEEITFDLSQEEPEETLSFDGIESLEDDSAELSDMPLLDLDESADSSLQIEEEPSLEFGDLSALDDEEDAPLSFDALNESELSSDIDAQQQNTVEDDAEEIDFSALTESETDSETDSEIDSETEESTSLTLEDEPLAFENLDGEPLGFDEAEDDAEEEISFEGLTDLETETPLLDAEELDSDSGAILVDEDEDTAATEDFILSEEVEASLPLVDEDIDAGNENASEELAIDLDDSSAEEDSRFAIEGFDDSSDTADEDDFASMLSADDLPTLDSTETVEDDITLQFEPEADASAEDDALDELTLTPAAEQEETVLPPADVDISQPVAPVAVGEGQIAIPGLIDVIDVNDEDFDEDILEVFLDEALELSEELDEAIHTWESDWTDTESVESVKRVLHTMKGGARLSGLENLGELTHDYESYLIGVKPQDIDDRFFATIHGYQDRVLSAVRAVKTFMDGDTTKVAIPAPIGDSPAPAAVTENEAPAPETVDEPQVEAEAPVVESKPAVESDSNVVKFAPKPKPVPAGGGTPGEFNMPSISGGGGGGGGAPAQAAQALKKAAPQEMVKVSAELLEELVNLAGETSISRARLEQQISDFGFALDEIDATLHRLQEQLRRLDIETEAQVLFRQEQMQQHEDFDPLEMDRYSHMQQLSRSLIESASDLVDLKSDLSDKIRDTETLLIQQQRINTTLQEGLMRSRMVPFSRLVPRLRRIVRQVASELGKNVSFELDNIEGELDRSVLERMVPPFEHMLRNAVDHGIEMPDERAAAGKPESGRIVLTLGREGGDVIIRLADDGRGVNLKRVREKAIERELMSADSDLSDHDIMQFILHAGFSTAESVTQISGRGVGMDVVHAEIKQLGGAVTINSAWGKGTEFVIRLPFTLSVNRALMVDIGGDNYAIPLSSIEGIVRVSPFELEHYYSNPEANFEYANEVYQVRYLGTLLNTGNLPKLEGQALPLPVILVRSHEHTMALQVDALMGSREIVVKSLGQQFSLVSGLSGATVMGDGSVVVILDPHALVRQEIARASLALDLDAAADEHGDSQDDGVKTVMVVDDSVTVRKVTTRFLEREGFDVITAKDGVDAIRVLQEQVPDLMLLDIEMPRMDGFEVARTIRTTQRWEHLPIIMITSRTGDKHREHALSLGVDKYLGKPYQEDLLLENIAELLERAKAQH
ncbi:Chemotaxis protein CheA [Thalassocella blandensis]|nr:Chemotaxis protein CheA [Thalassocella blandensis]